MAAFMENSRIEAQDGHSCGNRSMRAHFKAITLSQGPFTNLRFISPQIRDYLTKRDRLANQCNVYSARTVTDNPIKKGGDAYG